MSVKVMSAVFERYDPKGAGEMLLALALADVARDDGVLMINDSVPELARKTRQTDRGVQIQLRRMVATTWLLEQRASDGGRGRVSLYRINQAWLAGQPLPEPALNGELSSPFGPANGELSSPLPEPETVNWTARNGELSSPAYRPLIPNTNTNTPQPPLGGPPGPVDLTVEAEQPEQPEAPDPPAATPPKRRQPRPHPSGGQPVAFDAWLAACAERSEDPIPADDPGFAYAEAAGIGRDIVGVHWGEFKARHLGGSKRQADWRAVFRNSLRGNWYGVWWVPPGRTAELASKGRQALAVQQHAQNAGHAQRAEHAQHPPPATRSAAPPPPRAPPEHADRADRPEPTHRTRPAATSPATPPATP